MAQKADDKHTSSEQPVNPDAASCSLPELRQLARPVAALPLHRVMTLKEAFVQAKSRLEGDDLAVRDLRRHARAGRLVIAARWIGERDGTEGALVFRSAFWQHFTILPPGHVRREATYAEVQEVDVRAILTGGHPPLPGRCYYFVGRQRFGRLYSVSSTPAARAPIGQEADANQNLAGHDRRGPKPYEWDLYRAKFYLMLDDDDVSAYASISAAEYAERLMVWGQNNFGERETPGQTAMRGKITEWKPLWKRLKDANK